jgi:hypothetical protein
MRHARGWTAAGVFLAAGLGGCGYTVMTPLTPAGELRGGQGGVAVAAPRLAISKDVLWFGVDESTVLAVELVVENRGGTIERIDLDRISLTMQRDSADASTEQTRAPGAGAAGEFPGWVSRMTAGDNLAPVTVAVDPGETRRLWVAFAGVARVETNAEERLSLEVPTSAGAVAVVLAEPARGRPRWSVPRDSLGDVRFGPAAGLGTFFVSGPRDVAGLSVGLLGVASPLGRFASGISLGFVIVSPEGTTPPREVTAGVRLETSLTYPWSFRMRRRTVSVGPTVGTDLIAGSTNGRAWSAIASGVTVGVALLVDADRPVMGPLPIDPVRTNYGASYALRLGYEYLRGDLPGVPVAERRGMSGAFLSAAFRFGR